MHTLASDTIAKPSTSRQSILPLDHHSFTAWAREPK